MPPKLGERHCIMQTCPLGVLETIVRLRPSDLETPKRQPPPPIHQDLWAPLGESYEDGPGLQLTKNTLPKSPPLLCLYNKSKSDIAPHVLHITSHAHQHIHQIVFS